MVDSSDPSYEPGALKRHPDWPANKTVAQRQPFEDDDHTACTSWLSITPGFGTRWLTADKVADWPDLEVL